MKFFKSPVGMLLVAVIAIVAYAYVFEFKKGEEEKTAKEAGLKLFQAKEDEIVKIEMKWAGGQTILVRNEKNEWLLEVPVKDAVEAAAVNTILKGIAEDPSEATVTEDPNADLKIYGLDDPMGYVTIFKKDGSSQTVSFGQVDALGGKKYALIASQKKVVLIEGFTETRYVKTSRDFRSKRIQKTARFDIEELSVKVPKKDLTVKMSKKSGAWVYEGQKWDVEPKMVEGFLGQIDGLSAVEFLSEDKNSPESIKRYSTKSALATFEYKTKDGTVEVVTVHAAAGGSAYVTTSLKPTVYQVGQNSTEPLLIDRDYFRNKKRPFEFNKDAVENIEIKTSLLKMSIKKEGTDWKVKDLPEGKVVDQGQINKLIDLISELKVEKFVGEGKKKSLNTSMGSILLKTKDGISELELNWGDDLTDKERLATTNKSNEGLAVSKSSIAMLPLQTIVQDKPVQNTKPPAPESSTEKK